MRLYGGTVQGLERDAGKENGSYYSIWGLYRNMASVGFNVSLSEFCCVCFCKNIGPLEKIRERIFWVSSLGPNSSSIACWTKMILSTFVSFTLRKIGTAYAILLQGRLTSSALNPKPLGLHGFGYVSYQGSHLTQNPTPKYLQIPCMLALVEHHQFC